MYELAHGAPDATATRVFWQRYGWHVVEVSAAMLEMQKFQSWGQVLNYYFFSTMLWTREVVTSLIQFSMVTR